MVPESHELCFPSSSDLRTYLTSAEFRTEVMPKLREQYVVDVIVLQPKTEIPEGAQSSNPRIMESLIMRYTRNNAGGLKDAIDFLTLKLVAHGLDGNTVRGAIPRPKSDSFEDSMPFFDSKLLQRAEPAVPSESPTRTQFEEGGHRSIFDKLRKPGGISSFSAFLDRRKNNGNNASAASIFKHAPNNASKASLISMESRESGYRNPWNDSAFDEHDATNPHSSWGSFTTSGSRPTTSSASISTFESKFPFGIGNSSTTSLNAPMIPGLGGDITPKVDEAQEGQTTDIKNELKDSINVSAKITNQDPIGTPH